MDDPKNASVVRAARAAALGCATLCAVLGVGWHQGAGWAVRLWPWPEAPMTFIFLASIAASSAVVWLSIALSGEMAPLAGLGLYIAIAAAGSAAHLWTQGLAGLATLAMAAMVAGFALLAWGGSQPMRDPRAMPRFVRLALALFAGVLLAAGGALVWQVQCFPWPLHPSTLVVTGAIFVGAAAYLAHAAWQTRWACAAPPLWGLLAYDLVLLAPYLRLLGDGHAPVDDYGGTSVNVTSLWVYLAVLTSSGAVALIGLFAYPSTRLWPRRTQAARP